MNSIVVMVVQQSRDLEVIKTNCNIDVYCKKKKC